MAERVVVFDHEKITVWCYPKKGIVHHQIHAHVFGEVFQEALTKGVRAMQRYAGDRWLSDDRNNRALFPKDLTWAQEVWFPETVKAGWKYWALLPPTDVVGQMNIRRHIKMYKDLGITVDVFSDLDKAMGWLESA